METWVKVLTVILVLWAIGWAILAWMIAKAPMAEELWPNSPDLW